jgi:transposase InsO family protein
MRRFGMTVQLAAALAGVHAATLRRWRAQRATTRRCASPRVSRLVATRAEDLVRRLHGLIGAEALRRSVTGLSRRAALAIKARTLSAMERERKAALKRLTITQPGIVRGLDAMYFAATDGPLYALIAADGAIPFRSTLTTATRCDAQLVARTLAADFERHGAPLVLRLDRAKAHATPAVRALLAAHGVLPLHGPPHYPRFYGQLERQNREHRGFMAASTPHRCADAEACLHEMLRCVNGLWRRRALHWQTATEAWNARPPLTVDRIAFREEVHERARHIAHELKRRRQPDDLAERLGIERTLERMGYLRQEIGGWC